MNKQVERIKKDLILVTDAVNSFSSETVQLRVIDSVLNQIISRSSIDPDEDIADGTSEINGFRVATIEKSSKVSLPVESKKLGPNRILNLLMKTDFFDAPKSILIIAEFCAENMILLCKLISYPMFCFT